VANLIISFPKMAKKILSNSSSYKISPPKTNTACNMEGYGCKRQQGGKKGGKFYNNNRVLY
jgi:hypothetical protein